MLLWPQLDDPAFDRPKLREVAQGTQIAWSSPASDQIFYTH